MKIMCIKKFYVIWYGCCAIHQNTRLRDKQYPTVSYLSNLQLVSIYANKYYSVFSYSREQSIKTLHVAASSVTASVYTAEIYHILFIIEHSYPIQTYE